MEKRFKRQLGGFTLIELLVVVLIIGILSAIALPQYEKAVEKSRQAEAKIILRSLVDSYRMFWLANGSLPNNLSELDISFGGLSANGRTIVSKDFTYYFEERACDQEGRPEGECVSICADRQGRDYRICFSGSYYDIHPGEFICSSSDEAKNCPAAGAVKMSDGVYVFK